MTIAVRHGNTFVVDRGIPTGGVVHRLPKWEMVPFGQDKKVMSVVVGVGLTSVAQRLVNWAKDTHLDRDKFPDDLRATNCQAYLLAFVPIIGEACVFRYENTPDCVNHGEDSCAFGEGRDFAYGAIYSGGSAVVAAKAACFYSPHCAGPLDAFTWDGTSIKHVAVTC